MQSTTTIRIREATLSDAEVIASLTSQLGYASTTAEIKNRFNRFGSLATEKVFVAEKEIVLGWIHIALIESLETEPFAEIRGMVVDEKYRGTGIGTQLIRAAEEWAKQNRISRLRVRTNIVREETAQFYEKQGFTLKKTQKVFDKVM